MPSPEILLISAMLRQKDHITAPSRGITSEMFHGCREEFEWIENYIAVHRRTPSTGAFKEEFPEFVMRNVDDVSYFCEEVRTENSRIVLQNGLSKVIRELKNGDVEKAIREASSVAIAAEASRNGFGNDTDIFRDYRDIYREVMKRKKRAALTGFSGIPTGFPTLDELTGGIQPGWYVVVAARSGVGKTRSLVRMGCAATFSGYTSQYDALEQSRAEIGIQVHSFTSSEFGQEVMKSIDLAKGVNFSANSYRKFLRDMKNTVKGRFHVADATKGTITPATMAAQIERNKPDIFFLDQLSLVEGATDWQGIGNISGSLQRMAKRYNIPVVTAVQINRNGAGKRENDLTDLSGADKIGQDADLVITARALCKSVIAMTVTKFRHGRSGQTFYLRFEPNIGVMEEITYEEAMDLKDQESDKEEVHPIKFVPRKRGSFAESAKARTAPSNRQHTVKERVKAPRKIVLKRASR